MKSAPRATPLGIDPATLGRVRFDTQGLVPAVIQEQGTGRVLMMAWMNLAALERTLSTGRTWFWSRSRQEYWCKGETSGDRQWVRAGYYDCDGDTLLFVVEQEGAGACHTGERSCFYRSLGEPGPMDDAPAASVDDSQAGVATVGSVPDGPVQVERVQAG
ncbi:MAG: phosphoribosyl-AMP cyclohydrolase [Acidimicrobiales bacterium]